MQPSPEALAWQRRADAWAQQAESDDSQAVEPANRWSEVASTGRTTFPADGVGWRTETAEWRATGGARWRQTTEWRSTTGSHGWRSTTEAWQTNGNGEHRPPATTPAEQPALSSTAWSAPAESESRPSWQQFTEPATPSWQQPAQRRSPESTRAPESAGTWQQLVQPGGTIEGSATWNDAGAGASTETPSWQRREPETPSWQRTEAPSWQTPRDDGRHLVREDDRAAWRRDTDLGEESRPIGRRRAPETGSRPSGGTGWTARSDADNWAGHADTGGIQLYPESEETPTWGARADSGRRALPADDYADGPTRGGRHGAPALPSAPYEDDPTARRYAAGLSDLADPAPRRGRYADEDSGGHTSYASPAVSEPPPASAPTSGYVPVSRRRGARYADEEQRPGGPINDTDDPRYVDGARAAGMPPTRSRGPEQETGAGQPPRRAPGGARKARYHQGAQGDWREQTGSWVAEPDTSSWTRDPDTGQWSRSKDDPRVLAWREEAARREEAQQSAARRELPAAPADEERRASWSQPPPPAGRAGIAPAGALPDDIPRRGSRPDDIGVPPTGRASMPAAPRSAMPASPRSGMPASPRSAMPADPRSAMPFEQRGAMSAEPRSAMPAEPRSAMPFDQRGGMAADPRGAMSAEPRSAMPFDSRAGVEDDTLSRRRMAEGGRRRAAEDGPLVRGDDTIAPRDTGMRRRGVDDGPTPYSAMPDSGMRRRDMTDGPAPRSAMPDDTMSRRAMPDDTMSRRGMADGPIPRSGMPDSGMRRRDMTDGPAPRSAMPDDTRSRRAFSDDTAVGDGMPGRWGQDDDEPTPRRSRRRADDDDPSGYGARGDAYGTASANGYGGASPNGYSGASPNGYSGASPNGYSGTSPIGYSGASPNGYSGTSPNGYSTALPNGTGQAGYGDDDGYELRGGYDGPRPRSAMPSTGAPADGMPVQRALPSAPRSAMPGTDAPAGPNGSGPYGVASPSDGPYGGGSYRSDTMGGGRRRAAEEPAGPDAWRRDLDPDARQPRALPGYDDPDEWRANAAGRGGDLDDRTWPPRAGATAAPADWRSGPSDWRSAEREEASRGHAAYREGGSDSWRRELAQQSDLAEGESRRYGTSDFMPFRSSGSAAVPRQSNLSMTSTSMIMPAGGPDPMSVRPQRAASNGYMAPGGAYERRPVGGGFTTGRRSNLLDPDDEEDDQAAGGPLAAVGYTVIWYGVPVVLFVLYMLIVNRGSQSHALATAAKAAPQFGVSLVLSMLVAVGIRWVSSSWKAISVGLAAAVVGGGLATVLSSAITGNSLS